MPSCLHARILYCQQTWDVQTLRIGIRRIPLSPDVCVSIHSFLTRPSRRPLSVSASSVLCPSSSPPTRNCCSLGYTISRPLCLLLLFRIQYVYQVISGTRSRITNRLQIQTCATAAPSPPSRSHMPLRLQRPHHTALFSCRISSFDADPNLKVNVSSPPFLPLQYTHLLHVHIY
ncbi:hypothetical protein K438DRAFT_1995997 [Mycena galopus ATCC 62051]|nr:hypothetical protein K438DRAFT_1995997 [Mycena galopus ATCC 62051]